MSGVAVGPQGLDPALSYCLAAVVLIVLLAVLAIVCGTKTYVGQGTQPGRDPTRRKFWYAVLGADDRVSTSKVQFAMWTVALAWALLTIAFHDAVFTSSTLDPRYLLLLGFPAGAAVGAKAITTGQIASGAISKQPPPYEKKTLTKAVSDIVSNDQGDLDLGDAQYFLFNLVALTAFFIAFFHSPVALPVLPDTLVGLTSASAAAYVAKKATVAAPALALTAVSPQKGPPGSVIKVFGSSISNPNPTPGNDAAPDVTLGGLAAQAQAVGWTATVVSVTVPHLPPGLVDVQVVTSDGRTATLPASFEVTAAGP
jgi:IPT/TIG domain